MLFYCSGKKVEVDENTKFSNYLFKRIYEALLYNKEMVPGKNGIPKSIQFSVNDIIYFSYFETGSNPNAPVPFEIIDEQDLNFDEVYANTIFIRFNDENFKNKYISCKLSKRCCESDRYLKGYDDITSMKNNKDDFCVLYADFSSQSNIDKLEKYHDYFNMLLIKLESKEETRFEINLDLMKENYSSFNDTAVDDKSLLLPVYGKFSYIKEVVLKYTIKGENKELHINLQNCYVKNENSLYRKKLIDLHINLDEKTTIYELCDLEEQDRNEIEWVIKNDKTEKLYITEDLKGEITRLKRILRALSRISSENVENLNLVETICNNSIDEFKYKFNVNDTSLDEITNKYPRFKQNKEQAIAMKKVLDMDINNVDVMLIQGPPDTGKTELIIALIKELFHRGKNILVSSNVHVACDNIIERIKDDKEIIVKRYKNLNQTSSYKIEKLINQQNYVKSQVYNKYKINDNPILNFDELKSLQLKKANQLKEINEHYDELKTKQYDFFCKIQQLKDLETNIIQNKEKIETKQEEIRVLEDEIKVLNKNLSDLNDELSGTLAEFNQKTQEYDNLVKNIDKFKAKTNKVDLKISQLNDEITTLQNNIDFNKDNIKYIEENCLKIEKEIEELYSINIENLRNEIQDKFYHCICIENANNYFEKAIKKINDFISLVAILNNQNLSLMAITKKLLSNNFKDCSFISEILEDLEILNKYYSYDATSKILSVFKIKSKVNNVSYWDYLKAKEKVLNFIYNILSTKKEILNTIIDNNINKGEILKRINRRKGSIQKQTIQKENLEQKILTTNNSILQNEKNLENQVAIRENLQHNIMMMEPNVAMLKYDIDELVDDEKSLQEDILQQKKKLQEKNELLKNYYESLKKLEDELSNLTINEKTFNQSIDLLSNNEEFLTFKQSLDACEKLQNDLSTEINQLNNKIQFLNKCQMSLTSVKDNSILFDYIKELRDISNCKIEDLNKYFDGCGNLFDAEFNVGGENKGSILSMTTNQVAQVYRKDMTFDYAIIDEASKCSLQDLLISLPIVKNIVLIGDYMQLDPVYDRYKDLDDDTKKIFDDCKQFWEELNKSAFSLLLTKAIENNYKNQLTSFNICNNVAIMKRQYRMNKGIFDLISPIYKIHNGFELIDEKNTKSNDVLCLNIYGKEEIVFIGERPTYRNVFEANYIKDTIEYIAQNYDKLDIKTIGIITGYNGQVRELNKILKKPTKQSLKIEIGTFDRFQGKEFDLVLVSLVRTEKLGFLDDVRRMNVAFSRAKKHLIIFGNIKEIVKNCMVKKTYQTNLTPIQKEHRYVNDELLPKLSRLSDSNDCHSANEAIQKIKKMLEGK